MDLQKRMQLAQDLTAGRITIEQITPAEQQEAFGTVFVKGEAEGHPFRGNQWTNGEGGAAKPVEGLRAKNAQLKRTKHLQSVRDKFIEENPDTWDSDDEGGIYSYLEEEGYSPEEIDATMGQLQFGDSGTASLEPKIPNYTEQAMGMTQAEFDYLDEKGMIEPWGPSKEGLAHLESRRKIKGYNSQNPKRAIGPNKPWSEFTQSEKDKFRIDNPPNMTSHEIKNLRKPGPPKKATSTGHSTAEIKAEQSRRRQAKRSPNWKSEREKQIQDILDAQKLENDLFLQKIAKIRGQ